jgi:transcriptional regulator with XRE-family HTH domain
VDYTEAQRAAFAQRLKLELGTLPRGGMEEVAENLGRSRPMLNHWAKGATIPIPPVVFALEAELHLEPGELSQHLGYLPIATDTAPCTLESVLAADDGLDEQTKVIILSLYRQRRLAP